MIGPFRISNSHTRRAAGAALVPVFIIASMSLALAQDRGCVPHDAVAAAVKSASDGRSLVLSDGREVRLAAIEVPLAVNAAAASALAARANGRSVMLTPLTPSADRYGRLNMLAFDDSKASIDTALVAQGLALAAVRTNSPCLAALRAAEASARRAKLGLWGKHENVRAENPEAILAGRGGFAVVEGKILSVRESGGTIYLNFGRRWSEDFTVTILKRNERKLASAGVIPKQLEGRTVRIRGFIEERGGPWIEVTTPEQIEIADGR
jgi:endonuclease YncB( thermonuclease family)